MGIGGMNVETGLGGARGAMNGVARADDVMGHGDGRGRGDSQLRDVARSCRCRCVGRRLLGWVGG